MASGEPNDRTSEVAQIGFSVLQKSVWLIWSCPENVLSVRMSLGNFDRLQSLGGFFVSSETVSHLDCKTVCFFLKISKEIGKEWRKSLTCAKRASLTRP